MSHARRDTLYFMKVFGIFEGGGAKGLAHVGAIAAAQERGVEFLGVAGASAGAIVAALIAVGYSAKSLYDPDTLTGVLAADLTDIFGRGMWEEWRAFAGAVEKKLADATPVRLWLGAPGFYAKWRTPLTRMLTEFGFFDTAPVEEAVDGWLRGGLIRVAAGQERLLFRDLDPARVPPLRIIASDIDGQSPIVFSREKTPDIPVARAVAASIAIPFFFRPVVLEVDGETRTLVDGGLVANFPVWIFDDSRRRRRTPTPIIGFRLLEKTLDPIQSHESPIRFAQRLLETALNANIELHARGVDDLFTIPIEVDASTYEFDLTTEKKRDLYHSAKQQTGYLFLRDLAPRNSSVLSLMLKEASGLFLKHSGFGGQLRANLALFTSRETLRIVAGYNMERDADDRLEFELDVSACGECWTKHEIVVFDVGAYLRFAAPIPGLTKYQQAQVRSSLTTIMSVPIFDPVQFSTGRSDVYNPLIAILNFDSDEATVADFMGAADAAREAAITCGQILAGWLP